MTVNDWGLILTAAGTLASIFLSIYNLYLYVRDRREKLNIIARWVPASTFDDQGNEIPLNHNLWYSIQNIGEKTVNIYSIRVISDKQNFQMLLDNKNPPYKIEPGEMRREPYNFKIIVMNGDTGFEFGAKQSGPINESSDVFGLLHPDTIEKSHLLIVTGKNKRFKFNILKPILNKREYNKFGNFPFDMHR